MSCLKSAAVSQCRSKSRLARAIGGVPAGALSLSRSATVRTKSPAFCRSNSSRRLLRKYGSASASARHESRCATAATRGSEGATVDALHKTGAGWGAFDGVEESLDLRRLRHLKVAESSAGAR